MPAPFALLLDNLHSAVLLSDPYLRLRYLNPAAQALLGCGAGRSLGQPLDELLKLPATVLQQALHSGQPFSCRDARLDTGQGQSLHLDYALTPLGDGADAGLLIELHSRDSLQRLGREETQQAQLEASKLFARSLAHEIRNPLGGIRGAAQLLARQPDGSAVQAYTDVIIAEADRLSQLVERMLASQRQPQLQPCNIHELLERVARLCEAEAGGRLQLLRDYDPSIPELLLDPAQIIQALLNIVRNAQQVLLESATPAPQISLRSRALRQFSLGHQCHRLAVQIDISDNGPGIEPALQDNLFYPMISSRAAGSGLGLPISQAIIARHHGLIDCHSQPGQTTFSLYLPLLRENTGHEPR